MKLRCKLCDLVLKLGAVVSASLKLELLVHDGLLTKIDLFPELLCHSAGTVADS